MKFNVANSFAQRVIMLSDNKFHQQNYQIIYEFLRKNNYPVKMIGKIVNTIKFGKKTTVQDVRRDDTREMKYARLQYVPELSDKIKYHIKNNNPNIQLGSQPPNKLNKLFTKLKDKIPEELNKNIVYKIECKHEDCNIQYIGQTSKTLATRIKQHSYDLRKKREEVSITGVENINPKSYKTALVKHAVVNQHSFYFEGAVAIDKSPNKSSRELLESMHITLAQPNTCNFKTDTQYLSTNYLNVLKSYKDAGMYSPRKSNRGNISDSIGD